MARDLVTRWLEILTDVDEVKSKPHETDVYPPIYLIAGIGATIHLFELYRFDAKGRNSRSQVWPHPHDSCIAQIRETGRWDSEWLSSAFEEGQGYNSENDPLKSKL